IRSSPAGSLFGCRRFRQSLQGGNHHQFTPREEVSMSAPIRVAVTGAAGQIGYSLIFRIAAGEAFGRNQPVILHLIEIPPAMGGLEGIHMELDDCAFPTLAGVVKTDSDHLEQAFKDVNYVVCVGSIP